MKRDKSELLITKLEAPRRQLDSAIRMTLLNEDELAIHTVAAAAYRILRDIKKARGRSEYLDMVRAGIYSIADGLVTGRRKDSPGEAEVWQKMVQDTTELIRQGDINSPDGVPLELIGKDDFHWREFNVAANFLKHADLDTDQALRLKDIDNRTLLLLASRAYGEIIGTLTLEMEVIGIYILGSDPSIGVPWWPPELSEKFLKLSAAQRRRRCLAYIRRLKRKRR